MPKTVAIIQSSYIPWKGYFDIIAECDEFILFDDVQYTKRDWRNRNKIKTPQGSSWLSIPVKVKGKYFQRICDTVISDSSWAQKHWNTLSNNYAKAPFFQTYKDQLKLLFLDHELTMLSDVNYRLIMGLCDLLNIDTKITWSMDYAIETEDKTERLVAVCKAAGASHYISGPSAKNYIQPAQFKAENIELTFMNYDGYPEYEQLYPPFDHFVSVIDLLLMCGSESGKFIRRHKFS